MSNSEGERLEQGRRRKFWKVVGLIFVAGMILGAIAGFISGYNGIPLGESFTAMPDSAVIAFVALGLVAFTWGCWAFMKAIDEVEMADNLWSSTASYYAYAVLFPSWWVLGKSGITPEPNYWLIFFLSLAAGVAVYGYRKWRAR